MVFNSHDGLFIDNIPDDIIIPELIFDPRFGRRPLAESNTDFLVDAPTGKRYDIQTVQERTEFLAKGFAVELGAQIPWNGVIGFFTPNHVPFRGGEKTLTARLMLRVYFGPLIDLGALFRLQIQHTVLKNWHIN